MEIQLQLLFGQLLLGLVNGAFYALVSLGLSLIFGMLNVINFVQGALFMTGAFIAYFLLEVAGVPYWISLVLSPLIVAVFSVLIERTMLCRLYRLDHIYGWLLTYGLALMLESIFRHFYGATGRRYVPPDALRGGLDLGFIFLPTYRGWVIIVSLSVCLAVWYAIERTRVGGYLRASTENPTLVQAFGINVPRLVTLTYAFGAALAAFAGVLAAPIFQVSPAMGSNLIVVLFAVVVIGGLGSIMGTIVTGIALGLVEALTKLVYPQGAYAIFFVVMAIVLMFRPHGLFGKPK